jgi:hypothetical protein
MRAVAIGALPQLLNVTVLVVVVPPEVSEVTYDMGRCEPLGTSRWPVPVAPPWVVTVPRILVRPPEIVAVEAGTTPSPRSGRRR